MYPTQLHSYLLWRSSAPPAAQELASRRYTATVCLLPATMVGIFVFGWWAAVVLFASCLSAFATDFVCHRFIWKDSPGTREGTWLLTGLLLGLLLPPNVPIWVPIIGALLAVLVGKYFLSVDGTPLFMPVLVGLVGLFLISFAIAAVSGDNVMMGRKQVDVAATEKSPATKKIIPHWPVLVRDIEPSGDIGATPGSMTKLLRDFFGGDVRKSITRERYREAVFGDKPRDVKAEAVHGPRPIDSAAEYPSRVTSRSQAANPTMGDRYEALDMVLGYLPGTIGGSSALALALGILLLIFTGAASPAIPIFTLGTMFAMLNFFAWMMPGRVLPDNIVIHLLTGSTLIYIFFLAADSQTAPRSVLGRVYAGVMLGLMETLIRVFTPLPEGLFLSVLIMQGTAYFFDLKLAPPDDEQPVGHSFSTSSLGRL